MIIDITRKPVLVLPDENPESVIVRSMGVRGGVDGRVVFTYKRRWHRSEDIVEVKPGAQLAKGDSTMYETRLILPGTEVEKGRPSPYDYIADQRHRYPSAEITREDREAEAGVVVMPEPFEVASVFKDPLTEFVGSWRVGVRVEKHKNNKIWVVTILNVTQGNIIFQLALKGLNANPQIIDTLPLARAARNVAVGTAWSRILEDD